MMATKSSSKPFLAVSSKTVKTVMLELSLRDIIEYCHMKGLDVSPDAKVYFAVPSGGDYSGLNVDIDKQHPIRVRWVEKTEEESTS